MRWIIDHFLWDTSGTTPQGFRGWARGSWKLSTAVVGSALLTWVEWTEHHPPEIAIIALIHFAFVLAAIAVVVHLRRWLRRRA